MFIYLYMHILYTCMWACTRPLFRCGSGPSSSSRHQSRDSLPRERRPSFFVKGWTTSRFPVSLEQHAHGKLGLIFVHQVEILDFGHGNSISTLVRLLWNSEGSQHALERRIETSTYFIWAGFNYIYISDRSMVHQTSCTPNRPARSKVLPRSSVVWFQSPSWLFRFGRQSWYLAQDPRHGHGYASWPCPQCCPELQDW